MFRAEIKDVWFGHFNKVLCLIVVTLIFLATGLMDEPITATFSRWMFDLWTMTCALWIMVCMFQTVGILIFWGLSNTWKAIKR